jgi:peptidoglycan/LPS O-acetylase OafA/YrhL
VIGSRIAVGCAVALACWALFARTSRSPSARKLSPSSVILIDWLRGLAAVEVLLGHVRGLFMQDYEAVRRPSLFWKAFYALSGLGHQAVIVFFILSGFLVGATVLEQNSTARWDFRDYLSRRLVRLYTVLIPGLLLTAAWDGLGLHLFGAGGLYGGHLAAAHLTMPDVRVTLTLTHLLGNLAFLQHLFIAPYGTNGPLWSLSYEFWAYLLFPLLIRAGSATESRNMRAAYLMLAATILCSGGFKLALYFSVWLMGAALAAWFRRAELPARAAAWRVIAWLVFAAAVMIGRSGKLNAFYADPILGVATAVVLGLSLRGDDAAARTRSLSARASAWLAGFSYTLYVAHYPVLSFIFAALMNGARWTPSLRAVGLVSAISVAILLGYAYPLSRLTEAHTDALRKRFSAKRQRAVPVGP